MNWNLTLINNSYYIMSDLSLKTITYVYEVVFSSTSFPECDLKRQMLSCVANQVTDELPQTNCSYNRTRISNV